MMALLALLCALLAGCVGHLREQPLPLLLTFNDGTCSGAAIASHAILTATHCVDGVAWVQVAGQRLHVVRRIDDGNDHTLLITDEAFDGGMTIAPIPGAGAMVHIHGNPAELRGIYASGTVAGEFHGDTLLNVPTFYGDSGAVVLDSQDRVVGVISGIRVLSGGGVFLEWAEVKPLRFTQAQWQTAGVE